jgi:hypothetical protein
MVEKIKVEFTDVTRELKPSVTIIGDMKSRWMLDRREVRLGKAHKLNGVGCLHEKTTSSIGGDAGVYRHRLSQGI